MKGKHTMEEYEVISIPVSDGTERDFAIMDTFEFEGQGYLAVSLIEGDEIQEGALPALFHRRLNIVGIILRRKSYCVHPFHCNRRFDPL